MTQPTATLTNGVTIPMLGFGVYQVTPEECERVVIDAIASGYRHIDTAAAYFNEEQVGRAIRASGIKREEIFITTKLWLNSASYDAAKAQFERSLNRLQLDYLDLYLYHWRGERTLAEMVAAMEGARAAGKIRAWGVSNLDTADMEELWRIDGGRNCAANQVLYHMGSRGIDYSLLPWMRAHHVALMAYCPLAQVGRLGCDLLGSTVLKEMAEKYGATSAQVALAWAARDGNTIAIPRTGRREHAVSNAGADALDLTSEDCAAIDRVFPPPTRKEPLHIE